MGLLDSLFGKNAKNNKASSAVAKERLQVALISDRVKITPEQLEAIKDDIVNVISRHLDIDRDGMAITWGESHDRLLADIPVRRSRSR